MKPTTALLIFSALLLITIAMLTSIPETEKQPPEINYIIKAKTANHLYLIDTGLDLKAPLITNETGTYIDYEPGRENCQYILLTGGYYILDGIDYYYESIVEIETGNRSATYGVSGIEIIYFKTLKGY